MTQKYALQTISIKTLLANTDILDKATLGSYHTVFSMAKSQKAGFKLQADTFKLFVDNFQALKQARIIP